MDKNVHPIAAALIILVSILTLSTWLWCRGEAKEFGGPSSLDIDPRGHLYIQIQNSLIEHSPNGDFLTEHKLDDLGVERLLGGIAFFSNGDVLLRRGPNTRSIMDTVRAYLRQTNDSSLVPAAADTGLFRCNLETKNCRLFGDDAIDFKATYSSFIDLDNDDVYISDTSRHLVRKYDRNGVAVTDPAEGFYFPNQLMLHDGSLLIADTNRHRISFVDPSSLNFGNEIRSASVVPALAQSVDHRWPSYFVRVGNEWWVNNMSTDMNYGGIYVFDDEWNFQREVKLPDDADPIALINFNHEVLISDWYSNRVHRTSPDGDYLGALVSPGLDRVLASGNAERVHYNVLAWLSVFIGLSIVVALVIKGTDWSSTKRENEPQTGDDVDEPLLLEPDARNVKKIRRNLWIVRILFIPLTFGFLGLMLTTDMPFTFLPYLIIGGLFAVFYIIGEWTIRVNLSTSIRIADGRVTVIDYSGTETHSALRDVYYCNTIVAANDAAVFLGQPNSPIYDVESVLKVLGNRLQPSQQISAWAMQKKLVAMRHPHGLLAIAAVVVLLLLVAYEVLR